MRVGAARGTLPKSAVNLAKFAVFGFEIGGTARRGKFEVKFKSTRQDGLKI
ncbi:hypothetical protein CAMRE0001_3190 [Campylobacter rectus RM3267]|uniref:Uncharacterized protein n=1 Tax=Campylobacter rectus RM3267 TaxID=553218 RepID=B9D1A4_CAMRE|nr:hypothetical protein CAMRE0001_3190 [Campylobacter rectus RM3267]